MIRFGSLLIDETVSGNWNVAFHHPVDGESGLVFIGKGSESDGTGETAGVLIREEGAAQ